MMPATREELLEELRYASPLDSTRILQEMELYDKQSSQEIIDEVHKQFETGENIKDEIMKPVFLSVVDGFLESTEMGKQARRKGLTASRVIQECEAFRYDGDNEISDINGFVEYKNINEDKISYEARRNKLMKEYEQGKISAKDLTDGLAKIQLAGQQIDYVREDIDDTTARRKYLQKNLIGEKTQIDEYSGDKLYDKQKDPNKSFNDPHHKRHAQVDHIVPLERVHQQFKGNYALTDADIKKIANGEYNYAITAAKINTNTKDETGKLSLSNEEFIEMKRREGNPVKQSTAETMISKQKQAEKDINKAANTTICYNFIGSVNEKELAKKYDSEYELRVKGFEKKHNRKPTEKELEGIKNRLNTEKKKELDNLTAIQKEKGREIRKTAMEDAVNQSSEYAVGNLILYIVKPVYYELSDCLKNGVTEGVGASSVGEAFGIRFGRVKDYVLANAASFLGDNMWEFVKGFVSSLIEGIIGLFVGIFKQVLKLLKEGIKIFTKSMNVLFGPDSASMTSAEKGNAIVNILGSGVIAIAGIGLEALLNKLGIGEPWSIVFSTLLSGIAATLFMYLLNKADLFSVKAEQRKARIEEIFNERIKEIEAAAATYNIVMVDVLKQQRESFENVVAAINDGLHSDNIEKINSGLYQMADFMKIELPYRDTDGFITFMDSSEALSL